ncbi:hypothetical protein ACJBCE_37095 [Streptomyces sp. NBUL23]|uniref:hypothetical protein n=1 Tax=Streptomyces sp. NBUL23 TaxID=3381354 RepID=UPI00387254EC
MGWCDFWKEHLEDIPGNGTPAYCKAKDAVKDEVADAASSAWEEIVQDFQSGAVWMVKEVGLGWLRLDTPTLSETSGPVSFLFAHTLALTQWLAVLSLLLAAGHMAWARRAEPAKQALAGLLRLTIVSSAGVAMIQLLAKAGDEFSVWIVNRSLGCDGGGAATEKCVKAFSDRLAEMTALSDLDQIAVTLIVAVLLMFSGLVQLISIIIRQSMLFILAGTLPLAAAASGTERGMGWWKKSLGWIFAFLAFKPAAAIAYAAGFAQFSESSDDDLMSQLYGVTLLLLAALTLPALMRFIAPVVEEAGGSGLGGGSGRGASTAARIASGAIALKTGGASTAAKTAGAAAASGSKGSGGGATGSGQAGGSGGGQKPPSGGGTPPASSGSASGSGSTPGSTSASGSGSTSGAGSGSGTGSTSSSGAATGSGTGGTRPMPQPQTSGSGGAATGSGGTRPAPPPQTSPSARTIPARPWHPNNRTPPPPRQGGPRGSN